LSYLVLKNLQRTPTYRSYYLKNPENSREK
jgi:hypothetical protein